MALSKELQLGKAGEHMVCSDLILQGYSAFLADQGLPYDVLIDKNGKLKRIQVKSTSKLSSWTKSKNVYRFGTRRAKGGKARVTKAEVDYYAFVALDIKKVAYIPISEMISKTGFVIQTIDLREKDYEKYKKI